MMLTLIPWGYLLDRVGERIVLTVGLAMTAAAGFAAASVNSMVAVGIFWSSVAWQPPAPRRQRPAGDRLVPPGRTCAGDGSPADRAAAGNRGGRLGNARTRQTQPLARAAVSGGAVRGGRGGRPSAYTTRRAPTGPTQIRSWPTPTAAGAVANSRGFGAADGAATRGVDLHAGLVHRRARFVDGMGRCAGGGFAAARRARPHRGRPVVGPRRLADAAARIIASPPPWSWWCWPSPITWADRSAVAVMVVAAAITGDNGLPFTTIPEFAGPFWSGWALGTQNTLSGWCSRPRRPVRRTDRRVRLPAGLRGVRIVPAVGIAVCPVSARGARAVTASRRDDVRRVGPEFGGAWL